MTISNSELSVQHPEVPAAVAHPSTENFLGAAVQALEVGDPEECSNTDWSDTAPGEHYRRLGSLDSLNVLGADVAALIAKHRLDEGLHIVFDDQLRPTVKEIPAWPTEADAGTEIVEVPAIVADPIQSSEEVAGWRAEPPAWMTPYSVPTVTVPAVRRGHMGDIDPHPTQFIPRGMLPKPPNKLQ